MTGHARQWIVVGAAALTMAAVLSACADPSRTDSAGAAPVANSAGPAWPAATDAGTLRTRVDFPALGVSLAPPAVADKAPTLSAGAAYAECRTTLACPSVTRGPTITLARVTTANGGAVADTKSGVVTPVTAEAYVLRWDGVPCAPTGGVPAGQGDPKPTTCIWLALVDASTGQAMGSGQTNSATG